MVKRAIVLAHRLVFDGGSISPATVALIRRTLKSLAEIGVRQICVVDGEQAELLRDRLALHEFPNLQVEVLFNRSWRRASGSATLVARDFLAARSNGHAEPCLILRGDRPLDREALAELASIDLGGDQAAVVVATPPESTIDMSSEAKVRLRNGLLGAEVARFGLDIDRHDGVFTGHALITASIIPFLEKLPNPTLADGLAGLAGKGRVRALRGRISWPWGIQPVEVSDKVAALLNSKQHPHYTLMNPGPVNTTAQVKSALVHHDVSHRDSGFSELLVGLTGKLRRIFRATPGRVSGAMDLM